MRIPIVILAIVPVAALTFAGGAKSTNDTPLPPSPDGYRWERFTEVQSAFLCPTNWHRFHKPGNSSHTYVLSKESVEDEGSFETGLTVQVIKGIQMHKGMPPSAFATGMAQSSLGQKENTMLSSQDLSSGPFKAFGLRYRNAPAVAKPIIIHQVLIANDKTDTLFVVTLESPESSWEETWKLGEVMLKRFLIDDEY